MSKHKKKSKKIVHSDFLTCQELASYLGFDRRTIYDKAKNHEIPCIKIFGSWRFRKSDIDEWLKSCSATAIKKKGK